jgi:hypothetical protein
MDREFRKSKQKFCTLFVAACLLASIFVGPAALVAAVLIVVGAEAIWAAFPNGESGRDRTDKRS